MNWPIPLSVMDKLLLFEDRPAYPCSIFFRLRFSGTLDESAAREATRAAVDRHPLFQAVVYRSAWRGWQWHPAPDRSFDFEVQKLNASSEKLPDAFPKTRFLDLQRETGLCVKMVTNEASTDIVFQMHHTVCDGLGAMSFLADWLVAFANHVAPDTPIAFPELDPARLHRRAELGLSIWRVLRQAKKQLRGLVGVWEFIQGKPTPLIPHRARRSDLPAVGGYPAICTHTFSAEETARFLQSAKRQSATMNDLLVRDFFLAIDDWQKEHNAITPKRFIRLMIPMNVRERDDHRTPAANIVSSVFLDRQNEDFTDPEELLHGIHDQMQLIKDNELNLTFLLSLMLSDRLPGGIARTVQGEHCTISTVFSNLGPLFTRSPLPRENGKLVLGNAVLNDIDVIAPLRPYMCAAFALCTYADRLSISMQYDPDVLTNEQSRKLLARFADRFVASGQQGMAK